MDPNKHSGDRPRGGAISLNVHLAVAQPSEDGPGSHTPNTPELLNSLVNMQQQDDGPFAAQFSNATSVSSIAASLSSCDSLVQQHVGLPAQNASSTKTASGDSTSFSKDSFISQDAGGEKNTLSIENITKQFIKEGLKMKVKEKLVNRKQSKTKVTSCISKRKSKATHTIPTVKIKGEEPTKEEKVKRANLTPLDEERRIRRRERNKVAATKCRNKKKARTQVLMKESAALTVQNQSLKADISRLRAEQQNLIAILSCHEGVCLRKTFSTVREADVQQPDNFRYPDVIPPAQPDFVAVEQAASITSDLPSRADVRTEWEMEPQTKMELDGQRCFFNSRDNSHLTYQNLDRSAYMGSSCSHISSAAPFLGKRPMGVTYSDLDSRCIAL